MVLSEFLLNELLDPQFLLSFLQISSELRVIDFQVAQDLVRVIGRVQAIKSGMKTTSFDGVEFWEKKALDPMQLRRWCRQHSQELSRNCEPFAAHPTCS